MTQNYEITDVTIATHNITAITTFMAAQQGLNPATVDDKIEIENIANRVIAVYDVAFQYVGNPYKPEVFNLVHRTTTIVK